MHVVEPCGLVSGNDRSKLWASASDPNTGTVTIRSPGRISPLTDPSPVTTVIATPVCTHTAVANCASGPVRLMMRSISGPIDAAMLPAKRRRIEGRPTRICASALGAKLSTARRSAINCA